MKIKEKWIGREVNEKLDGRQPPFSIAMGRGTMRTWQAA